MPNLNASKNFAQQGPTTSLLFLSVRLYTLEFRHTKHFIDSTKWLERYFLYLHLMLLYTYFRLYSNTLSNIELQNKRGQITVSILTVQVV